MRPDLALIAIAACALAAGSAFTSQNEPAADMAASMLDAYDDDEPGAAIAIIRNGELIFSGAAGSRDLSSGAPLDARSQMRIASLSKAFVAVLVLKEAEAGRLDLDDPVRDYLPELAPAADGVTIRHLLQHTGGLPHHSLIFMNEEIVPHDPGPPAGFLFAPAGSRDGEFMPTNEDVVSLLAAHPEPRFAAGEDWEYSNTGYILLVQVLESVRQSPFRTIVRESLFDPLGMTDSGVFDEQRPRPQRLTYSYIVSESGFEERDYSPFNLLHGDGGLYASLDDLVRWRSAFTPGVLLSDTALATLAQPARLSDGTVVRDTPRGSGYGMGWFLTEADGQTAWIHGGGWAQFRHAIFAVPEAGVWVVYLSNRSDTQPYEAAEMLALCALDAARCDPPQPR